MSVLTEKQIKYGFNYYHNDDAHPKSVVTVSEYTGEKELVINCTQLEDTYSSRDKKRILREWCEFLLENPDAFSKLVFCTRMPQELFDAVCCQRKLTDLHIKWGVYPDISKLEHLQSLKYLHLGSGRSVSSINPIAKLKNLVALSIENFLSFLRHMPRLRSFSLLTARVLDKDYSPLLELIELESLTLKSCKEVKDLYPQLIALPKLKYGTLVTRPYLYNDSVPITHTPNTSPN